MKGDIARAPTSGTGELGWQVLCPRCYLIGLNAWRPGIGGRFGRLRARLSRWHSARAFLRRAAATLDSGCSMLLAVQKSLAETMKGCNSAMVGKAKAKSDGQSKPLAKTRSCRPSGTGLLSGHLGALMVSAGVRKVTYPTACPMKQGLPCQNARVARMASSTADVVPHCRPALSSAMPLVRAMRGAAARQRSQTCACPAAAATRAESWTILGWARASSLLLHMH